jgi:hypothetical protein
LTGIIKTTTLRWKEEFYMPKMAKRVLPIILATQLLLMGKALGSASQAGGVFLTIFPGAKATAMGAAFSAVADDATASYYNPGAIAFFNHTEFSLIHAPWLRALASDMYYEYMGFVKPLGKAGGIGGHIIYLTLGELEARKEDGTVVGRFRPYDVALDISYGLPIREDLGFGFGFKLIHSFLAPGDVIREVLNEPGSGGSATSAALDAGIFYKTNLLNTTLSAVVANIGPGLKYTESGRSDPLPSLLRLGVAVRPIWSKFHKITLSFDINKVLVGITYDYKHQGISYILSEAWRHVGLEYTYFDFISLRIGYFHDYEGKRMGFTFGGGIKFKSFKLDIADDSRIYDFQESSNRRFAISYVMGH